MQNSELRAQFLEECQRWGETIIASCKSEAGELMKIKVFADDGELDEGLTYSFFGRWTTHYKYGRQFVAKTFVKVTPASERGVVAYLMRAPNVGPRCASMIWHAYGAEAVRRLRTDPVGVAEKLNLKTFSVAKADEAAAYLESEKATEDATIACREILDGKGFPRKTIENAIKLWGNRAAETIKKNAFKLMQFKGCGFARCDQVYLEQGGRPERMKRQTLCVWYGISRDTSGSTWFDMPWVMRLLADKIGGADADARKACILGRRSSLLSVYRPTPESWPFVTERKRSQAEQAVADIVAAMLARTPAWPDVDALEISDHQKLELGGALRAPIGLFGGSPGTGKTYSAARLIGELIAQHGSGNVAVVAPTGKAAVRITELLQGYGLNCRAETIHRFLGVGAFEEGGSFTFEHDETNPVEQRFVICDESSMVDTEILAHLLRAMRDDGHLLLVGDVQQLPPVGHGAPLRDLLEFGVPSGDLKEIRRNSGMIVTTCAQIRNGESFVIPRAFNIDEGQNLRLEYGRSSEESQEKIVALIRKIRDHKFCDPVWETQVVVAVNEKSALSRKELNRLLQVELNGGNRGVGQFWVGDKVVCLKNQFFPAVEDAMEVIEEGEESGGGLVTRVSDSGQTTIYVANGELGRVTEVFPNRIILEFQSPRRVVLAPLKEEGEESKASLDLGYAISAHKSQGSEWPVVIVAIDEHGGARMVCDRSWIYTAISRAKKACVLVGKEEVVRDICLRQKIENRKTFLVERLRAACSVPEESGSHGGRREEEAEEKPAEDLARTT